MQRSSVSGSALAAQRHGANAPARWTLDAFYHRLFGAYGPQHWWPAASPFEMMVGAILTQATTWHNVELAIERLKGAQAMDPRRLAALPTRRLERAVRPAGSFRQKARRLKVLSRWFVERYGGSSARLFARPWRALREELLCLHGVGPETADAILLYAGKQPVFVVDAYTTRVFRRHGLIGDGATYDEIQHLAMRGLAPDPQEYNEFHALMVAVGKRHCHRRAPDCTHCPLGALPHTIEVHRHGKR